MHVNGVVKIGLDVTEGKTSSNKEEQETSSQLNKENNYTSLRSGKPEDLIGDFSHTFGLHHSNIILVKLEIGSPGINV
jgi:hypothetical protein